jgi:hypothetical protein
MRLALELRGLVRVLAGRVEDIEDRFFVAEYSKGNYFTVDVRKSVHHFCDLPRNVQQQSR